MQVYGDGPLQLLVVECQSDLALRATAKVRDEPIADDISLRDLMNRSGRGRFSITLDPKDPLPGQQPYQGVVRSKATALPKCCRPTCGTVSSSRRGFGLRRATRPLRDYCCKGCRAMPETRLRFQDDAAWEHLVHSHAR